MLDLLKQIFTWWNGATIGTRFHTWKHGEFVGQDDQGNRYFQTKSGKIDPALGIVRRWVLYKGDAEASRVPGGWYGWLHHRVDVPPTNQNYQARDWELPHQANLTGTSAAYRPRGSIRASERRVSARDGYEPWSPNQ